MSESEYVHGVVQLTDNKDVLARLERLKTVKRDPATNKHVYSTMFNGRVFNFVAGEPKTFPIDIAKALEASNHTYLDEKCAHCKGQGSTPAGICINCKGRKLITSDAQYRTLKIVRTYDAMLMDPAVLQAMQPAPSADEPIAASVAGAA